MQKKTLFIIFFFALKSKLQVWVSSD